MKKIEFDFLATMELKEVDKPISSIKADLQPAQGADFRLFADGAIYPSEALIAKDQLEYAPKDSTTPAYGYDVFLSKEWLQYDHSKPTIVCIAKVSKNMAKVDLFSRTKYDADGSPKSSVAAQKNTSGEQLIKMLEAVYCEEGETLFDNGRTWVDLKIMDKAPIQASSNGIYLLPKEFIKGSKKGQITYERRESIQVFALDIVPFIQHPAGIVAQSPKPAVKAEVYPEVRPAKAFAQETNHVSAAQSGEEFAEALFGK